jgi:hypothetical protein
MTARCSMVLSAMLVAVLSAQTERITIRRALAPDQTIHVRIASEWDYDQPGVVGNVPVQPTSPQPRTVHTDLRVAYSLSSDVHKEGEPYKARLTFDEAAVAITANGQPSSSQQQPFAVVVGKSLTASYDAQGRFQDVDVPFEISAGSLAAKLLFINGAFTAEALLQRMPPAFDVTVGNTVEVPSEVALPIPGMDPAVPGGRRLKLISVEREGGNRIAKFEQTFEGVLSGGMLGQDVSLSATGAGTVDWNVDRGFLSAYEIRFTLDATSSAGTLHHTVHTRLIASS